MTTTTTTTTRYKTGLQQRLSGRMVALLRVTWFSVTALALLLTLHPSALLHSSWFWLTAQVGILMPAWSALAVLSLVPVLVLRKKQLRLQPTLHPTRLHTLFHLVTAHETFETALAYTVSWLALFAVWIQLCTVTSPDPDLKPFHAPATTTYSKSRAPQVNPRLAYLASSTFVFALLFAARHSLYQFSVLRFQTAQTQQSLGQRTSIAFFSRLRDTFLLSVSWSCAWPVLWSLFKNPLLRTFIYPTPLRPFFASLYKQFALSPSTMLRSGSACLFCGLAWDVLNVLLDVYLTQPVIISYLSPTPNATLLEGIQSQESHTQHMAYLELVHIVSADAKRRKAIFDDVASDPPALALFMRACLTQLSADRSCILNPSSANAPAPAPAQTPSQSNTNSLPSVPVKTGGVVQQSRSHFLDRFAKTQSDPSLTPPPSAQPSGSVPAAGGSNDAASAADAGSVPSILRNASQSPSSSASGATTATSSAPSTPSSSHSQRSEVVPFLLKKALGEKSPAVQWLLDPLPGPAILQALPQPELDAWIAQILSALLCHSLQEDTYGLAQKELPKTLEGLVQFSSALESLIKMHQDKHEVLQQHVQPVLTNASNAFSDIATAFKPFLKEFRLSQGTSQKVKAVLDYR